MSKKTMGKYDDWEAVFVHPLAGKVTWRTAPPHSIVLFALKSIGYTAILHLEWRDTANKVAYYKLTTFLK